MVSLNFTMQAPRMVPETEANTLRLPLAPSKCIYSPLEGVRGGVEPSLGEGRVRLIVSSAFPTA